MGRKIKDRIGIRYGRLIVKEFVGTEWDGCYFSLWLCKCDCGNETIVKGINLQRGNTKSCGCLRKEIIGKRFKNKIGKNHPTYINGITKLKEKCRKEANYKCQDCDKTQNKI